MKGDFIKELCSGIFISENDYQQYKKEICKKEDYFNLDEYLDLIYRRKKISKI